MFSGRKSYEPRKETCLRDHSHNAVVVPYLPKSSRNKLPVVVTLLPKLCCQKVLKLYVNKTKYPIIQIQVVKKTKNQVI